MDVTIPGADGAAITPPAPDAVITPPADDTPSAAEKAEADEWASAENEIFPGLHKTNDDDTTTTTTEVPDEQTDTTTTTTEKPAEDGDTTTTTTVDPSETPEQKVQREKREADAAAAAEEAGEPDTSARDARLAARESAKAIDTVAADVREKMYKDAPTVLQDADGDPIRTVADVMQMINPRTITAEEPKGRGFTEEEAGMWLLAAQSKFNQDRATDAKEINRIAEVNVDLKDQADSITYRYGALLKADTALRDRIWAQYDKTLRKDADSGVITDAPVDMVEFYDIALAPYLQAGEAAAKTEADKAAADKAAADAETARKKQEQADRSDIFGGGNIDDNSTDEEKEWASAMETVYGPMKQPGKK